MQEVRQRRNRFVIASKLLSFALTICILLVLSIPWLNQIHTSVLPFASEPVQKTARLPFFFQRIDLKLERTYRTQEGHLEGVFILTNRTGGSVEIPVYLQPPDDDVPIYPKFVQYFVKYYERWLQLDGGEDGIQEYVTIPNKSSRRFLVGLSNFSVAKIPEGSEVKIRFGDAESEPFILGDHDQKLEPKPFKLPSPSGKRD